MIKSVQKIAAMFNILEAQVHTKLLYVWAINCSANQGNLKTGNLSYQQTYSLTRLSVLK